MNEEEIRERIRIEKEKQAEFKEESSKKGCLTVIILLVVIGVVLKYGIPWVNSLFR